MCFAIEELIKQQLGLPVLLQPIRLLQLLSPALHRSLETKERAAVGFGKRGFKSFF